MPKLGHYVTSTLMIAGLLISWEAPAVARKRSTKTAVQDNDQIDVAGHLAFDGTGVTGVLVGDHWRKNYLYLNSDGKMTVVDVTNSGKPTITGEYRHSLAGVQAQVVIGSAALLTDAQPTPNVPHSVSILSFADPVAPAVVRQFTKVTGFLIDSRRGLIYVVNNEGLWILYGKPGRDLEFEKQYERELMYNR